METSEKLTNTSILIPFALPNPKLFVYSSLSQNSRYKEMPETSIPN